MKMDGKQQSNAGKGGKKKKENVLLGTI